MDLIPGEKLVGGDVKRLAERARVAEQAVEAARKVVVVREHPERGAVAVHDHRFSAAHAIDDAVTRRERAACGSRRCATGARWSSGSRARGRRGSGALRRRSCRASSARTGSKAGSTP